MAGADLDAAEFVRDLNAGLYDAAITEELGKLSTQQLHQVAEIIARQDRDTIAGSVADKGTGRPLEAGKSFAGARVFCRIAQTLPRFETAIFMSTLGLAMAHGMHSQH
jgi:hypothetical protein